MSVVAWDGKIIAADKQATNGDMRSAVRKLRRLGNGEIVGWTGDFECGLILADLYEKGTLHEKWPAFQGDKDRWTRLIVVDRYGLGIYEQQPVKQRFDDKFMAFGTGRDYALAAMAMGADAIRAVEVTCEFCTSCGLGVQWYLA